MIFEFEDFELDAQRLELRRGGHVVEADTLVLRLLVVLVRNAGVLVPKNELAQEVWEGRIVGDNAITVAVARLRKVLGDKRGDNEMVTTVYGRGYRFARSVRVRSAAPGGRGLGGEEAYRGPLLVGRERAFAALHAALEEARRGRGRFCALLGEAGIGKTYAIEGFLRALPEDVRVSVGFCREAGDTPPLFPWLRLLRDITASVGSEAPELQELAPLLDPAAFQERVAAITEELWLESYQRHRVFDAVARLLSRASERVTWVLVLEDLHRADGATLELLSVVLDELARRHVLIVASVRHGEGPSAGAARARLLSAIGHRNCERISLERLREDEVRAYVKDVLGERAEALAQAVYRKSEGNPFFMAELCRQVRDRGPHESDVLTLPEAALELVRQRVRKLDADALGVLSAAAVVGRTFELGLLHAITGREMNELMNSLDAAIAAEVLKAAEDSSTAFAFGHELLRAVLYDALSPTERRSWHVRVAQALEQRAQAGDNVAPSDLAYHLHAGLPDSDPRETVRYCRMAAATAAAAFANEDVVRYMRHALEALDLVDRPSVRMRMHLLYLLAMYARGDSARAYESATRELSRLARHAGDASMLVRAAIMYNLHPGYRQLSGAAEEFTLGLSLLPQEDLAMRAVALSGLAMASPTCFSRAKTTALVKEAVALARASKSRAARYVAGIAALQLLGGPDHAEEAHETLEELTTLAQQNPTRMPVLPVDLALYRSVRAFSGGDLKTAQQAAFHAALHSKRLHHSELLWHAERLETLVAMNRGETEAAFRALKRLHERAHCSGMFGLDAFVAFDRAMWNPELCPGEEGEVDLEALAYDPSDPPSLWSLKLRALSALGEKERARAALKALAPEDLAALPCDRDLLGTLGHVAHAAVLIDERAHAEQAAARLAAYRDGFAVHVGGLCEGSVPHVLGSVALALGDADRAVVELTEGIARDERAGLTLCAGYARLSLGRALLCRSRGDDRREAQRQFEQAHAIAERTNMRRLARAASPRSEEAAH